jgi:hypothetical protein
MALFKIPLRRFPRGMGDNLGKTSARLAGPLLVSGFGLQRFIRISCCHGTENYIFCLD